MNFLPDLAALLAATGASFYFSGMETGIYALNRVRLRIREEEGDPAARRVGRFVSRPQRTISVILIGNQTANYLATFFCMSFLVKAFGVRDRELVNTLVLTPFLFVFGEIVPKDTFRLRAETLVYRLARPLAAACVILAPAARFLRWLGHVSRALPKTTTPRDAILSRERLGELVHEVTEEGVLSREQRRMVRNVLRFASVAVRDTMVPRAEVDAVRAPFSREAVLAASARRGHSRIPVEAEGTGRLAGFVNVLDLLYRPDATPLELVRAAPEIPAVTTVREALHVLRRDRQAMGIVTGADGRTVGIVTVKDLVEEVSGELPAF